MSKAVRQGKTVAVVVLPFFDVPDEPRSWQMSTLPANGRVDAQLDAVVSEAWFSGRLPCRERAGFPGWLSCRGKDVHGDCGFCRVLEDDRCPRREASGRLVAGGGLHAWSRGGETQLRARFPVCGRAGGGRQWAVSGWGLYFGSEPHGHDRGGTPVCVRHTSISARWRSSAVALRHTITRLFYVATCACATFNRAGVRVGGRTEHEQNNGKAGPVNEEQGWRSIG